MSGGQIRTALARFFIGSYLVLLVLCAPFLRRAWLPSVGSELYALLLLLAQATLYLVPAFLVAWLACGLLLPRDLEASAAAWRRALVQATAVVATTLTAVALAADARILELFGFHLNGFVLNLLTTPGGLESMGLGRDGVLAFARAFGAIAFLELLLLWAAQRRWRGTRAVPGTRLRVPRFALAALAAVVLAERSTYAIGEARSAGSILEQANAFPLYFPITARNLLLDVGIGTPRGDALPDLDAGPSGLVYPLQPLRIHPPRSPRNVVWLVGESLRADLLEPEIMPELHGLSREAWRFTRHYSGGNGTRMGMFSMFYGVHGPYWFQFLAERRSPVLVDVLQQQGYQLGLFTSARFSYPEFDRTIFARVPASAMHDSAWNYHATDWERGWRNDRERVSELLDFLARRDRSRPFFAFMFFESTHFRYYFPDESVIRRPYARDLDLGDLGGTRQAELRHARYLNAAHHLDGQIGRILDVLRRDGDLADTIVLVTGDHGEEFLEKGRQGHNSEFHEEQIRVPLVLWVPGDGAHVVDATTSHVDIPPTILPLLGVRNPASDYALGNDLRAPAQRESAVVADWSRIGIVDGSFKLTIPIHGAGLLQKNALTTRDDRPLGDEEAAAAWRSVEPELRLAMEELERFRGGAELRVASRSSGRAGCGGCVASRRGFAVPD